MSDTPDERRDLSLHCLGGLRPADDLVGDIRLLLALPAAARAELWDVLGPSLAEPVPREVAGAFDRFLAAHAVDAAQLGRALRAARTLVRQASALDVSGPRFAEDLTKIADGAPDLAIAIVPGYERIRARLRADIVRGLVADHGRVLERVRWRVDVLADSDQILGLRLPVLMLTLHYRDGERREQLSLQVLPEVAMHLRAAFDRLLGGRKKPSG